MSEQLNQIAESGNGKLYEANTFVVPVLSGTYREMGHQYGALMVDHMQHAYDVLLEPGRDAGAITDDDAVALTNRAMSTFSTRNREFYEGIAAGSGWPIDKVGMLDQVMEFGMYQSKLHAFAGCTTIMSWGGHSADGGTYIGRNMDWTPSFNDFAQVLTVRKPNDGSYRYATVGWPGMYGAFTSLNEHGTYLDIHDGTSMGGSVVYVERPPILNILSDLMSEVASRSALVARLNGITQSTSLIYSLADEAGGASVESSSLGGNRLRSADGESLVVVNTFLNPDWGLGPRETVSNSLRRLSNMTERLAENEGSVDARITRDLMDLTLFNADGTFAENGGATKPTVQDSDSTNYQTVVDVQRRQMWLKVPAPDHFADWTHFDLGSLWSNGRTVD
jgi:hypothetical protein